MRNRCYKRDSHSMLNNNTSIKTIQTNKSTETPELGEDGSKQKAKATF